jgi:hypothetical protein
MASFPFRVPIPPLDRPIRRSAAPFLRSLRPSTASSREPHGGAGCSRPTPDPLSGFLNLSAVLQQARVPRPCFMPQPFLIASFRAFPSHGSCAPLEATGSLAVIHQRCVPTVATTIRAFHRTPPPEDAVARIPSRPEVSFDEPKPASRFLSDATTGPSRPASFTHFGALLPLRVRSPRAELPRRGGRCSPGRSSPPKDPSKPRSLGPARPRGPNTRRHPEALACDTEDRSPQRRVRPCRAASYSGSTSSAVSRTPSDPDRAASRRRLLLS